MLIRILAVLTLLLSISACNSSGSGSSVEDQALRALLTANGLTGDPSLGRSLPKIESPLAQLGMALFYAKSLGGDSDSACVSCHHPMLGGGDGIALSIGVGAVNPDLLGPGRQHPDGDFTVPRNAPTTFNLGMYDAFLFWDGRVESLGKTPEAEGDDGSGIRTPDSKLGSADPLAGSNLASAQARFPVTSNEEMRGFSFLAGQDNAALRNALEARLSANSSWRLEFAKVFGDERISFDRIAAALAEYERSQVFVDTPWRSYVSGDDSAISRAAKRGALLFFRNTSEGGADCASCHSGDFFTDEKYHSILAPQIGRGKGDGPTGTNDYGRARETKQASDRFLFRTPALHNLTVTAPYTHAGAFNTLEEVVRHHLEPVAGAVNYDPSTVAPASSKDYAENMAEARAALEGNPNVIAQIKTPLEMSDQDISNLVSFLKTLTDPCVEDRSCLAAWIPGEDFMDPDGSRLRAVNEFGEVL